MNWRRAKCEKWRNCAILGTFCGGSFRVSEPFSRTFVSLEDTTLGDVPAVELIYQTEGLKGTDQVINYWYERGDKVYQVVCSYSELTALKYEPIFENIMGT